MSGYIGNIPVPQATQTRQTFTATASQTTFNTAGYSPGYIDVFLNGVKLAPADYTATNGSDVVLAVGAASGDILETVAYEIFQVLDQDFTGDFTVDGSTFVVDSTNNSVGIGTSSPNGFLEIDGTTNDSPSMFISHDGNASIGTVFGFHSGNDFRLWNYENGVVKFGTNNAEAMRIDSSGNFLVGKTSSSIANDGFQVHNTGYIGSTNSGASTAYFNRKTNDGDIVNFQKDGTAVGSIASLAGTRASFRSANVVGYLGVGSSDYYGFKSTAFVPTTTASYDLGGSAEKFKDLYLSGTVNSGGLTVDGGTAYHKLISTFPSTYKTNLQVGQQGQISNDAITDTLSIENTGTAGATNIQFSTAGSERMRIDSSGNLLVGTTDTQPPTNNDASGIALRTDGKVAASRSNGISGDFNNGSAGDVIWIRQAGTVAGIVGTINNDMWLGTDNTGLRFINSSSSIVPIDPSAGGTTRDNAIDLGESGGRFQDLYLSGGVYLGGVGSSNLLDDYEEGTWTPTLLDGADVSQAIYGASGRYTKIGRTVHVNCVLTRNNTVGTSGNLGVGNLPFQCGTSPFLTGGMWIDNGGPSVDTNGIAYMGTNSTTARGIEITSPGQRSSNRYFQYDNLTNGRFLYLSMTYQTA